MLSLCTSTVFSMLCKYAIKDQKSVFILEFSWNSLLYVFSSRTRRGRLGHVGFIEIFRHGHLMQSAGIDSQYTEEIICLDSRKPIDFPGETQKRCLEEWHAGLEYRKHVRENRCAYGWALTRLKNKWVNDYSK